MFEGRRGEGVMPKIEQTRLDKGGELRHFPFEGELKRIYAKMYPDAFSPVEQKIQEAQQVDLERKEARIQDLDLMEVADEYGVSTEAIERREDGIYILPVFNHFSEEKRLPEGYAYKGGAARALLLRSLGIDPTYQPRDVDVVRLTVEEPKQGMDDQVSQEFMPEDYENGYGVEVLGDQEEYFGTRDLTINEVLATDTDVLASKQAILDSIRRIIRLTDYEREDYGAAGPKMLSKILRFYAESVYRYGEASIQGVEDWEFEDSFITPFWLALQLDRAVDVSSDVAEKYVEELVKKRQLPEDVSSVEDAANYLFSILRQGEKPFYYRHAPTEQFNVEAAWFEKQFDSDPKLAKIKV